VVLSAIKILRHAVVVLSIVMMVLHVVVVLSAIKILLHIKVVLSPNPSPLLRSLIFFQLFHQSLAV